jgi:aminoglycoside phosphotransferase (APT) family kinase protein
MRALRSGGVRVPVPETYGACEDPEVIGAPFYVMEHVRGAVVRDTLPEGTTDARLRELGRSMIETLAAIHETPVAEVGLGELGRPEGFLERQLRRMQMQWERIRARNVPELDELGRWLADHLPSQERSSLVHGDYKLDNLIVGLPASGEVCAVIDWELSTRADPLIDLGWWLYFWLDPGEEPFAIPVASVTDAAALPRRAELIERYAATTGRPVDGISWYVGFGGWKITIIMETSYQRFRAGIADHPAFAALDEGVPMMAQRALALARERA